MIIFCPATFTITMLGDRRTALLHYLKALLDADPTLAPDLAALTGGDIAGVLDGLAGRAKSCVEPGYVTLDGRRVYGCVLPAGDTATLRPRFPAHTAAAVAAHLTQPVILDGHDVLLPAAYDWWSWDGRALVLAQSKEAFGPDAQVETYRPDHDGLYPVHGTDDDPWLWDRAVPQVVRRHLRPATPTLVDVTRDTRVEAGL